MALVLVVASVALAAPRRAHAADDPAARSLFEAGLSLMDEGKVDEACPKFEESLRLQSSVGAQLNLARCHELQGKIATAWTEYRKAAALARDAGDPKREESANMLADGLEAKLPKLVIAAEHPIEGMTVTRDGAVVGQGSFGVPMALDPGEHRVEASAPGYRTWSTIVHVPAEPVIRTVAIPELEPGAGATPSEQMPETDDSGDTLRMTGYVLGATGLVATVVGAVLGGLVMSDASDAESDPALCPNKQCTAEGQDVIDSAYGKATAATVLVPVGGALLLTGVVLVVAAELGSADTEEASAGGVAARVLPAIGSTNGLCVVGTF